MKIPKEKNIDNCGFIYAQPDIPTEDAKTVGSKISTKYFNKKVDKNYYSEFSLKSVDEALLKIKKETDY